MLFTIRFQPLKIHSTLQHHREIERKTKMCVDHKLFIRASASVLILYFYFIFFLHVSLLWFLYSIIFVFFLKFVSVNVVSSHSLSLSALCMVLAMVRASLVWQIGFWVSRCLRTQHNLIWVAVFTLISTFFFFCHYFILILFRFRRGTLCLRFSFMVCLVLIILCRIKDTFFSPVLLWINMVITCKIIQKWH